MQATCLEKAFHDVFFSDYKTKLVGGFDEPFYLACDPDGVAQIQYRYDYASSALHEISHWCVAGPDRRKQDDFGYWYAEDGRTLEQQKEFEQYEVRPQAYECLFHWACNMRFDVSVDNLAFPDYDPAPFRNAVLKQVGVLLDQGLPQRVESFARTLFAQTSGQSPDQLISHLRECHENYRR